MRALLEKEFGTKLPRGIGWKREDDKLLIEMTEAGITSNMQNDSSAFEAWALLAKANGYKQIVLSEAIINGTPDKLHYNRFLYRVLRFSEGFSWFTTSEELKTKTSALKAKLNQNNLVLNVPLKEASDQPHKLEAKVEALFARDSYRSLLNKKLGHANVGKFYRQLPVGLFEGACKANNEFFSSKAAAIDLWGIDGDSLHIIELKVEDNIKLGVLSELFFYVCFVYDMHCLKLAKPEKQSKYRGYSELQSKLKDEAIKYVIGHILTQQMHSKLAIAFEELKQYKSNFILFRSIADYEISEINLS